MSAVTYSVAASDSTDPLGFLALGSGAPALTLVMKLLLRLMLPLAVATWLALPGIGSDGGDNAGGTGVWILPRPTFLASGSVDSVGQERGSISIASCSGGFALATGIELGDFTATFIDPISGVPIALPTCGRQVLLDAALLSALKQTGVQGRIVVSDSQHLGYVMNVTMDGVTGACTVRIY
jgi:hypothetical protein